MEILKDAWRVCVSIIVALFFTHPLVALSLNIFFRLMDDCSRFWFLRDMFDSMFDLYKEAKDASDKILVWIVLIIGTHLYFKWLLSSYYLTDWIYQEVLSSGWVWIPFALTCVAVILDLFFLSQNILGYYKKRSKRTSKPKELHEPATSQD